MDIKIERTKDLPLIKVYTPMVKEVRVPFEGDLTKFLKGKKYANVTLPTGEQKIAWLESGHIQYADPKAFDPAKVKSFPKFSKTYEKMSPLPYLGDEEAVKEDKAVTPEFKDVKKTVQQISPFRDTKEKENG